MNYKEILANVIKQLNYKIEQENDPSSEAKYNDCVKGWYNGLKSAKEIITRCICEHCTEDDDTVCDKCENKDCILRGKND